jgi:methyl-accepting chemotaxis protein
MFGWQRNADRAYAITLLDREPVAAQMTPAADIEIRQLSVAARTIEGFASLIGDITEQIDLLNATIESACACEGEFAVVAGEVRTLAAQVRLAADAIATAVAGSDGISSEVAAALEGIRHAIHRINTLMADAIAAASIGGDSLRLPQHSRYRN